jgi:hypothetical protein
MNYLLRGWAPEGFEDVEYFHVKITPDQAQEILKLMDRWNQMNSEFSGLQEFTLDDNGCLQGLYPYGEIHEHIVEDPEDEYIDLDKHPGIENAEQTGGVDMWSMTICKDEVSWNVNCKHTGVEAGCSMLARNDMEEILKLAPRHLMKSIAAGESL